MTFQRASFFFFSSRRRHTRYWRDWSSDVCSSDLSPSRAFPLPAVIRLAVYIRKPFLDRVAFNKKNILRRDGYACQYCNRRGDRLTVDHVLQRTRGGETTWTNVVAACL